MKRTKRATKRREKILSVDAVDQALTESAENTRLVLQAARNEREAWRVPPRVPTRSKRGLVLDLSDGEEALIMDRRKKKMDEQKKRQELAQTTAGAGCTQDRSARKAEDSGGGGARGQVNTATRKTSRGSRIQFENESPKRKQANGCNNNNVEGNYKERADVDEPSREEVGLRLPLPTQAEDDDEQNVPAQELLPRSDEGDPPHRNHKAHSQQHGRGDSKQEDNAKKITVDADRERQNIVWQRDFMQNMAEILAKEHKDKQEEQQAEQMQAGHADAKRAARQPQKVVETGGARQSQAQAARTSPPRHPGGFWGPCQSPVGASHQGRGSRTDFQAAPAAVKAPEVENRNKPDEVIAPRANVASPERHVASSGTSTWENTSSWAANGACHDGEHNEYGGTSAGQQHYHAYNSHSSSWGQAACSWGEPSSCTDGYAHGYANSWDRNGGRKNANESTPWSWGVQSEKQDQEAN